MANSRASVSEGKGAGVVDRHTLARLAQQKGV
jgi:hypothetical protein